MIGPTSVDEAFSVSFQTPGTLQVNGPARLDGQVMASRVIATGSVAIWSEIPTDRQ